MPRRTPVVDIIGFLETDVEGIASDIEAPVGAFVVATLQVS